METISLILVAKKCQERLLQSCPKELEEKLLKSSILETAFDDEKLKMLRKRLEKLLKKELELEEKCGVRKFGFVDLRSAVRRCLQECVAQKTGIKSSFNLFNGDPFFYSKEFSQIVNETTDAIAEFLSRLSGIPKERIIPPYKLKEAFDKIKSKKELWEKLNAYC
jgi:hypothetical protein